MSEDGKASDSGTPQPGSGPQESGAAGGGGVAGGGSAASPGPGANPDKVPEKAGSDPAPSGKDAPPRTGDDEPSPNSGAPRGRIVVADDVAVMRNLLVRSLKKAGYAVREARNGSEVLEAVAAERPDLIVMDSMMPVMSGPECLRNLKASPETQDIPVIMCTAKSEKRDVLETAKAGAVDYIVKPFRIETVLERVARQMPGGQEQPQP